MVSNGLVPSTGLPLDQKIDLIGGSLGHCFELQLINSVCLFGIDKGAIGSECGAAILGIVTIRGIAD